MGCWGVHVGMGICVGKRADERASSAVGHQGDSVDDDSREQSGTWVTLQIEYMGDTRLSGIPPASG